MLRIVMFRNSDLVDLVDLIAVESRYKSNLKNCLEQLKEEEPEQFFNIMKFFTHVKDTRDYGK